jgi:oxygen-independent coproporphyrinogen-3 oxidase
MEGFDAEAYRRFTASSNNELIPKPLSLYVHLPFCKSLCYYCGCMKKVTRHTHQADQYLELLEREIAMQGKLFDHDREVIQLHLGGGTPTFHTDDQLSRLIACLGEHFSLSGDDSREFSVEVDPRTVGI